MTKHLRFTMKHGKYVDDLTGKEYDEKFESWNVCNLLNELSEENEQLKQSHKEILRDLEVTTFDKELLQKENEQLKEERDYFERKKCEYQKKISILTTDKIQLKQENERLKQHIKRVLHDEYNKCDIPVWRRQYVKSLAEKLGVELK